MTAQSLKNIPYLPATGSLINGRWLAGDGDIAVHDKYNGETVARIAQATRSQVAEAVKVTHGAAMRNLLTPVDRAKVLRKTAELLDRDRDQFIATMVAEAGFTIPDAQGELDRSLITLGLSAEEATRLVGETVSFGASPGQHTRLGMTIRAPLGVICAITPFNSPLNTVIHKVAPSLAGGNGVVLKPSALTPLTSALLCEKLLEAGLPPELLALVHGGGETTGTWLLEEPDISFYTFTGSTRVGREIQRAAGLRKTQLELGSIASVIVCADADLQKAATKIANAAFRKAGQVCTSVQRLYVERGAVEELQTLLAAAAKQMPAGDPRNPATRVGPMISESAAIRIESWVKEAQAGGAAAITGGQPREGSVIAPTILTKVKREMKVVDQEAFGPIVSILPFDDVQQAIKGANDSPYGLAAGFFSSNIDRALKAAQALRFGAVHINETSSSRADGMPFGGVKDSGYGHEGPAYAIREVTEERLITFNL
jgi:succinate-semialdehyde dehydrogenase/glutarate-semialdehyde dehydrogenase